LGIVEGMLALLKCTTTRGCGGWGGTPLADSKTWAEPNVVRTPNLSSWRASNAVGRLLLAHYLPCLLHIIIDHYNAQLTRCHPFLGSLQGRKVLEPSHHQLHRDAYNLVLRPRHLQVRHELKWAPGYTYTYAYHHTGSSGSRPTWQVLLQFIVDLWWPWFMGLWCMDGGDDNGYDMMILMMMMMHILVVARACKLLMASILCWGGIY
jgi:hypothetical protein